MKPSTVETENIMFDWYQADRPEVKLEEEIMKTAEIGWQEKRHFDQILIAVALIQYYKCSSSITAQ